MSNFIHTFGSYSWNEVSKAIHQKTADDVSRALQASAPTLDDFMALISPAGQPFLEKMAQKSKRHTQNRFGNTCNCVRHYTLATVPKYLYLLWI